MAYDATITTEDEVDVMAGENVNATGATADRKAALVKQAESYLSVLMGYNIVDNYSGLNEDVQKLFNEYGARYAGKQLILFNMQGYTSVVEAEDMINVHIYRMEKIEDLLVDKHGRNSLQYIKGA